MNKEVILNKFNLACIKEYNENKQFMDAWLAKNNQNYESTIEAINACKVPEKPNLTKFWSSFDKKDHQEVANTLLNLLDSLY